MRKTLKWVATENNLFTLINKDVYATVEQNSYKGEFDKRWILSFRKYNGVEPIGNPTANLYFDLVHFDDVYYASGDIERRFSDRED